MNYMKSYKLVLTRQFTNSVSCRKQLSAAEEHVRQRSRAAEGHWSCDKWQQSSAGVTTSRVLAALDALDRHAFDRMDISNCLDTLYAKVFLPSSGNKEPGITEIRDTRPDYVSADFKLITSISVISYIYIRIEYYEYHYKYRVHYLRYFDFK